MSLATKVPASVQDCLNTAGLNHRPVLLAVDTDVSLDAEVRQQWLVATRDHLSVVDTSTSQPRLVRFVERSTISAAQTSSGVGSGLLRLKIDDQWTDLLRFSNALSHRFHKVSRWIDLSAEVASDKNREAVDSGAAARLANLESSDEPFDPPRCPNCELRLKTNDESCPRCLQRGQILQRIWPLLKPHWKGAFTLVLLTIVGVIAELIPPKLQQYMVDHLLLGRTANDLDVPTALLMVVLALATSRVMLSIVGVMKGRVSSLIGSGLTCSLRLQMVEKLQSMAVSYYDRHNVGSLISRVSHDSEVLHGLMHQLTGGFLLQLVKLVGIGIMLMSLNTRLALYTLIPVPLVFLGSWFFWQKVYPRYFRLRDASAKQMTVLNGMLHGVRIVKAFAQEDHEYNRFESAANNLRDWRLWVEYANARYSAAMQLVFSLGGLIVWYVGGRDVIGKEMTLGQLMAFLAYLSMFYAPLGALSNFTTWLTSFLSGSKRVMELLDSPQTIMEPEEPTAWPDPQGAIRFNNVTFGYDHNQPVLKGISFEVEPGEMIGIVGRSGSGKTTMVNMLGRFYDPQEGQVLVDDIDVRDISLHELRENIGVVFQDSVLFRGTVWSNLSYGRPDTTIEEGLAAARAAGAHDFICRKQLGYESQLGQHGAGLSGGEKQRLSIARTLLYDPKVLILDEATSNIDAESEKSIQEALEVLVQGRTTVAIAHRLSTLRNADRILVFDNGRLVEQGSHAELLELDGTYARLVRIQTQVSKDPNVDLLLNQSEPAKSSRELVQASASRHSKVDGKQYDNHETQAVIPDENDIAETTAEDQPACKEIRWLDPNADSFIPDEDAITLLRSDDETPQRVFAICTFPATRPQQYLSIRTLSADGDDTELGIVRDLNEWPDEQQAVLKQLLKRHYLLPRIEILNSIKLNQGFLELDVETDLGSRQFVMRWTQSRAVEFGENGKLLIDTDGNRYVVPNIESLHAKQREKFLQFIYW